MAEKIVKSREERIKELQDKKAAELERHKKIMLRLEEDIGVLCESRMPSSQKWKNLFAALKKNNITPEKVAAKFKLEDVDFGPESESKKKSPKADSAD